MTVRRKTGFDKASFDKTGSDKTDSGKTDSGKTGSDKTDSDKTDSGKTCSGHLHSVHTDANKTALDVRENLADDLTCHGNANVGLFQGAEIPDTDRPVFPAPVSDEQWRAIAGNDASYDGRFFYAVKTTRIFCRPSCKSRLPKRENIGFFQTADQALAADYRPCKRCRPTGAALPDEEWIALVTDYVDAHCEEALSLDDLAQLSHGTPYHLHRTFRRIKGMTPVHYIQQVRIEKAKTLLHGTRQTVAEIGEAVGLSNTPYFITLFKKKTGQTPEAYRRQQRQSDRM